VIEGPRFVFIYLVPKGDVMASSLKVGGRDNPKSEELPRRGLDVLDDVRQSKGVVMASWQVKVSQHSRRFLKTVVLVFLGCLATDFNGRLGPWNRVNDRPSR
jgi:hypothetical protein